MRKVAQVFYLTAHMLSVDNMYYSLRFPYDYISIELVCMWILNLVMYNTHLIVILSITTAGLMQ